MSLCDRARPAAPNPPAAPGSIPASASAARRELAHPTWSGTTLYGRGRPGRPGQELASIGAEEASSSSRGAGRSVPTSYQTRSQCVPWIDAAGSAAGGSAVLTGSVLRLADPRKTWRVRTTSPKTARTKPAGSYGGQQSLVSAPNPSAPSPGGRPPDDPGAPTRMLPRMDPAPAPRNTTTHLWARDKPPPAA